MILEPLTNDELNEIFDETSKKVLRFYMKKAIILQPEVLPRQHILPIQVPKEHVEQWVLQAIGGEPVGAGSFPVDIVKPNQFGVDVKMLSCSLDLNGMPDNSESGEASLAQKFNTEGINLDNLFEEGGYERIVDLWRNILYEKLSYVSNKFQLEKIYYIFILRAGNNFFLCGTRVNINEIQNMNIERYTKKSVFVSGLIDSTLGQGKIYQSKKRLELRLRPANWINSGYAIQISKNYQHTIPQNMRYIIENNMLYDYKRYIYNLLLEED